MKQGLFALCLLLSVLVASIAAQTRTVWNGVFTAEQATRGRALYGSSAFVSRRRSERRRDGSAAGRRWLQSSWNGLSVGDLSERIRVSMPLGQEGTLSRQQVSDVIAAILTAGEYPAGATELTNQPDVLKTIQITPRK
jgi:hypothetical protein